MPELNEPQMGDESTARVHCGRAVDLEVWVYRIPARDKMEAGHGNRRKRSDRKDMKRQTKYTEAVYVTTSPLVEE